MSNILDLIGLYIFYLWALAGVLLLIENVTHLINRNHE